MHRNTYSAFLEDEFFFSTTYFNLLLCIFTHSFQSLNIFLRVNILFFYKTRIKIIQMILQLVYLIDSMVKKCNFI